MLILEHPMNARVKELGPEARALTAGERCSLDAPDSAIDAAWAAEARDRLEAWRRGETTSIPADRVFAKYLKP